MFRRFVTRCTSVYVLSIHTLCSHSLNEYTTVLEVWDFPFLLPHNPPPPSSSLLHPPSRAMKVSRVGSYSTPLTPTQGARDVGSNRAACQTAPALYGRKREATTPQPPPPHRDYPLAVLIATRPPSLSQPNPRGASSTWSGRPGGLALLIDQITTTHPHSHSPLSC
jgi:hypothetical protein